LGTEYVLDKEQALALDAAIRHLALNIRNARRFKIMQRYAEYDALTGVHNRRHFENRIDDEFRRFKRHGRPLSILMADIDHFKRINDTRGHQTGDAALREVASILANTIRKTDYCARYGGEEFVILLPYTGARKALALAERIRKIIAAHIFLVNGCDPLHLTVSFGVSGTGADTERSKTELVSNADAALYNAKFRGRNCSALIAPPRRKLQRK
jgi:diguanylate cyclase (GGDEF)-like protein